MTTDELLAAIGAARQRNIFVYARLASLGDPVEGFVLRRPGGRDVTLEVLREALRAEPAKTRAALQEIIQNDLEVIRLTQELAHG